MRHRRSLGTDERGLVGKIVLVWIVLAVLLLVAGIDTAEVLLTRYRVADAAQTAAFDAAATLERSRGDRDAAYRAALDAVEQADADATLTRFVIDAQTGRVTVTVTSRASTLIAGRIGLTRPFTKAKATEVSEAPTP
jgi:Flp pilus assembly protein TadG